MTVLALKLSRRANAVSSLHGQVSRAMWAQLYPGVSEEEIPIGHITNGVHVPTLARRRRCASSTTAISARTGRSAAPSPAFWEAIDAVDDGELWETHQTLKTRLIDFGAAAGACRRDARGESPTFIAQLRRVARSRTR